MKTQSIDTFETLRFVKKALGRAGARVLEVGCGNGALGAALAEAGFEYTGIDPSPEAIRSCQEKGLRALEVDLMRFDGGPFDAVLLTRSLHHVEGALEEIVAHVGRLLEPGGTVVVDEFSMERADGPTARWFYELWDVLEAAGAVHRHDHGGGHCHGAGGANGHHGHPHRGGDRPDPDQEQREHRDATKPEDPLARWAIDYNRAHIHHTGSEMESALEKAFEITLREETPYLFRFFAPEHDGVARMVLDLERRRIALGEVRSLGLRLVGRAREA